MGVGRAFQKEIHKGCNRNLKENDTPLNFHFDFQKWKDLSKGNPKGCNRNLKENEIPEISILILKNGGWEDLSKGNPQGTQ